MKASKFTVLSLILALTSCQKFSSSSAKTSPKIDLIHLHLEKSLQSEKLIESILTKKNDSLLFKVSTHTDFNSTLRLNISSVIIFDSVESFRQMRDNIYWQTNKAKRYKHLVYFPGGSQKDLELIRFGLFFENHKDLYLKIRSDEFSIDSVNFLIHKTDQSIELVSAFMFTSQACRKNQFLTINRFERSSMKWNSSIFYPNKYRNLHRCELYFYGSFFSHIMEFSMRLQNS